jgi:hypothetical protein
VAVNEVGPGRRLPPRPRSCWFSPAR